jgi:hypothetical protein
MDGILVLKATAPQSPNLRICRHFCVQLSERPKFNFHEIPRQTPKYFFIIDFYQGMRRSPDTAKVRTKDPRLIRRAIERILSCCC